VYLLSILSGSGVSSVPNENVVEVESLTVAGCWANRARLKPKNRAAKKSLLIYDLLL
jgi:hypothetical protein